MGLLWWFPNANPPQQVRVLRLTLSVMSQFCCGTVLQNLQYKIMNWNYNTDLFTSLCICQSIYTVPSQSFCSHTKYIVIALKNNGSKNRQNGSSCILIANSSLWGWAVCRELGIRKKEKLKIQFETINLTFKSVITRLMKLSNKTEWKFYTSPYTQISWQQPTGFKEKLFQVGPTAWLLSHALFLHKNILLHYCWKSIAQWPIQRNKNQKEIHPVKAGSK